MDRRSAAPRIFLVHAVEQRQLQLLRVDQGNRMTAIGELALDIPRHSQSLAIRAHRAKQHNEIQVHATEFSLLGSSAGGPLRSITTQTFVCPVCATAAKGD